MAERVQTSFILDTLQYMHKGGRCTGVAALGANLLNLKPCIEVKDGSMEVGKKYRGKLESVLEQYTEARLKGKEHLDLDQILIAHCYVAVSYTHLLRQLYNHTGSGISGRNHLLIPKKGKFPFSRQVSPKSSSGSRRRNSVNPPVFPVNGI